MHMKRERQTLARSFVAVLVTYCLLIITLGFDADAIELGVQVVLAVVAVLVMRQWSVQKPSLGCVFPAWFLVSAITSLLGSKSVWEVHRCSEQPHCLR